MTGNTYTPAPWLLIETPDKVMVSSWHIQIGERKVELFPYKRVYSDDRTQSGLILDHQQMADARLMTAAPELLAALKEFVHPHQSLPLTERERNEMALAAIAKALGTKE